MNVDVSTQILIHRPRADVAAFAPDPDNAPRWYENIKSVTWETEPPLRVGSRVAFVAEFLGRRLAYTYEVIALAPGQRVVMQTRQGPFPMETTYLWEAAGDGTLMTLKNRGDPMGFAAIFAPFMKYAIRRANRQDLLRLKRLLEAELQQADGR
jgi:uncharacterized membrane protein